MLQSCVLHHNVETVKADKAKLQTLSTGMFSTHCWWYDHHEVKLR